MNNCFKKIIAIVFVGLLLGTVSYKKDKTDYRAITEVVFKNCDFTLLKSAVVKADVDDVTQAKTNLSYLATAVLVRVSQGITNVSSVLSFNKSHTIFATTNQVFIDADLPTIALTHLAAPNTFKSKFTYQVLSAKTFASGLVEGQSLSTLNGSNITVGLNSNATVKRTGNTSSSNITVFNIMVSNGVKNVIDKVLLS